MSVSDLNESSISDLFEEHMKNPNILMIGTTVATGFEWEAIDECREKLQKHLRVVKGRGKVYFNIDWDQFAKVQEMRSIDNIYIVADTARYSFGQSKESKKADLELFVDSVNKSTNLSKGLDAWKRATNFKGKLYPTIEEYNVAKEQALAAKTEVSEIDNEKKEEEEPKSESKEKDAPDARKKKKRGQDPSESKEDDILKYRVTCERTGEHSFESNDVAKVVGGELQEKYHWIVDLCTYHLEIVCKLMQNFMLTHLRVTHESKHRRNIENFGPTTLRSTICYNLLRLAHPKPGDLIVDPMCGGGSIPIEAALAYPQSHVLCGDNHPKAVNRAQSNASVVGCEVGLVQWNASKLPFKDSFVDIIVTDMPFGKRSGTKSDNRVLYKQFLLELGRVVKLSSGRIVLLTYDRNSFKQALQTAGDLFWVKKTVGANIGGLQAVVYVLSRTHVSHHGFKPRVVKQYNRPKA
ncbi:hypothetical protein DMN91_003758 [Ooceraea biroi]|uniref:THUMP domain-containing protein n=1 Tax=Ooceraea biroi TaxID=2015173 RepID=A0A3L8DTR4_OOCBI|nr:THUMP domain-containing protein 3 [Ooceraea biroi]RLU23553.1 hypothetical protein DMN91_003758 [Ooceraea biroi]